MENLIFIHLPVVIEFETKGISFERFQSIFFYLDTPLKIVLLSLEISLTYNENVMKR